MRMWERDDRGLCAWVWIQLNSNPPKGHKKSQTGASTQQIGGTAQLEILLIPKCPLLIILKVQLRLERYPQKCNCVCTIPTEVGKSLLRVKNLVTAQTQLRLYSEQQRVFGISNISYCPTLLQILPRQDLWICSFFPSSFLPSLHLLTTRWKGLADLY